MAIAYVIGALGDCFSRNKPRGCRIYRYFQGALRLRRGGGAVVGSGVKPGSDLGREA